MSDSITSEVKSVTGHCRHCVISLQQWTVDGLCVEHLASALRAQLAAAKRELEELQAWVHDLQAGMYINCVYCGHRYGPEDEVPATMADALKEHVERCPKHPMSVLRIQLAEARAALEGLRGLHCCPPAPGFQPCSRCAAADAILAAPRPAP